ncbi:MAG: helicase [Clostridia bacterium]|nr:helicase [Clostridia bacterium]
MDYYEFLKTKDIKVIDCGFEVDTDTLSPKAYIWQKDIVKWALKKGRAALFEDCGLGKTLQELMIAKAVADKENKPSLILTPLAVADQTRREGEKFGIEAKVIRNQNEIELNKVNITNYEILSHFDLSVFGCVILDESSILKDYTSNTKKELVDKCSVVPYRYAATATPSPNDYVELGNHAEFLGIMSRTEMLATYFVHDGGNTSKWRLKGHAADKFFQWVASWSVCVTNPADLGYDGSSYILPPLNIHEHIVKSSKLEDANGQIRLFASDSLSLNERRAARRDSLEERVKVAATIANGTDKQVLVWCDLNDESKALTDAINGAVEVRGDNTPEHKVNAMNGFTVGNIRSLVSKPKIAGWGMNWQNCNIMIFVGLSDSFEAFYQAVRRCWRFGQKNPVDVYIITSEADGCVKDNIERKQSDAERMKKELVYFTKDILTAEIRHTTRITESYMPTEIMILPNWLRSEIA